MSFAPTLNVVIGCDYIRNNGSIDETFGMFGVLDEAFTKVKTGNIVPAHNNTRCAYRRTKLCNMDCKSAVYGIQCGGKISFRNKGKTM